MKSTRKQRHAVYEAIAIAVAGFCGGLVVPELLNLHSSMAAGAAFILLMGWVGWIGWYLYRQYINSMTGGNL